MAYIIALPCVDVMDRACVDECPVDCIYMQPVKADYLPQARHLSNDSTARFAAAEHARTLAEQYDNRNGNHYFRNQIASLLTPPTLQ